MPILQALNFTPHNAVVSTQPQLNVQDSKRTISPVKLT